MTFRLTHCTPFHTWVSFSVCECEPAAFTAAAMSSFNFIIVKCKLGEYLFLFLSVCRSINHCLLGFKVPFRLRSTRCRVGIPGGSFPKKSLGHHSQPQLLSAVKPQFFFYSNEYSSLNIKGQSFLFYAVHHNDRGAFSFFIHALFLVMVRFYIFTWAVIVTTGGSFFCYKFCKKSEFSSSDIDF